MKFLIPLFVGALALISCGKGYRAPQKGGGVIDGGGGGDFVYHSQESVLQIIDETWNLLISESLANPILHAYGVSSKVSQPNRTQRIARQVLFRIAMGKDDPSYQFDMQTSKEQAAIYKRKKPRLEMNGLCAGPYDQKYLASVNRLDISGDICISVHGLMRLPSGGLRADLIGLLIHEAAHLQGFDEEHARAAQKFVMDNINTILLLNHEEARYLYLNQAWNERFGLWPLLLHYGEIDSAYAEKAGALLYALEAFRAELNVETHILRSASRRETRSLLHNSLDTLLGELEAFAIEIQKKSETPGHKITVEHLNRVRTISRMIVDAYNQFRFFLFGDRVAFEDIGIPIFPYGPRLLRRLDQTLIEAATDPKTLTDGSARLPEDLVCKPNLIERRTDPDLDKLYAPTTKLMFIRCALGGEIRKRFKGEVDALHPKIKSRPRNPPTEFTIEPDQLLPSMR